MKVRYKQGDGARFDETGIYVNGILVATYRKRVESYRGIRGSNGRRLGRYTYYQVYEPTSEPGGGTVMLAKDSTRKRAVAEALVKLAYRDGELVRPDLVEAAYEVEPDIASLYEERLTA